MIDIRIATAKDGPAVADIYRPLVLDTTISFETDPPDGDQMAQRISSTLETHPWLIAAEAGAVIAYANASAHRSRAAYQWSCDVTIYTANHVRRSGVARALYARLLVLLEQQGFVSAFAGIALPNDPSIGFHEALGFEHLGTYREVGYKLGGWRDVGWWRRPLAAPTSHPDPPLAFADLLERGGPA
ncbi:arsinothricin resistance N-acetyltransferase ArsN1 family B [Henriciella marina]|uniref:arsinothricin resistance N-acetyltransferase ArsN1 family B n=1 Tax=Henriciella marina TaxID=453851 RepID=UPI00037D3FD3|nr:arsinothricin resistance N-acetyltransferase ArsN1 family B [Henriciella marina]